MNSACSTCESGETYRATCWNECQADWEKPCATTCLDLQQSVMSACTGCTKVKDWCGKRGFDGLPDSWPAEACIKPGYCDDDGVDPRWMATNYPSASYEKAFSDRDFLLLIEFFKLGGPNCQYPLNPWGKTGFPLCAECHSVFQAFEDGMLWGGPCNYAKQCDKDGMSDAEKATCKGNINCGCDCARFLSDIDRYCTAGENQCDSTLPPQCNTKQADEDDYRNKCEPKTYSPGWQRSHIWGMTGKIDESQCVTVQTGMYATQCEESITPANSVAWKQHAARYAQSMAVGGSLPSTCCVVAPAPTFTTLDIDEIAVSRAATVTLATFAVIVALVAGMATFTA